jgi:hypothetical protein
MTGLEIPTALTLTSLAAGGGAMLTNNPTAKKILGGVSLASGLGGMGGLGAGTSVTGASMGGASAAKTAATPAANASPLLGTGAGGAEVAANPLTAGETPGFGSKLMDIVKSGTVPIAGSDVPLSAILGVGSMALPEGTAKKVLGGTGLALGLGGLAANAMGPGTTAALPGTEVDPANLPVGGSEIIEQTLPNPSPLPPDFMASEIIEQALPNDSRNLGPYYFDDPRRRWGGVSGSWQ